MAFEGPGLACGLSLQPDADVAASPTSITRIHYAHQSPTGIFIHQPFNRDYCVHILFCQNTNGFLFKKKFKGSM